MGIDEFVRGDKVPAWLQTELVECWIAVTNGGGAVGFPFPPVDAAQVTPVADTLIDELHPQRLRLLTATVEGALAGWLTVRRDPGPLVAHWGVVSRVQTHPRFRGRGIGTALMQTIATRS